MTNAEKIQIFFPKKAEATYQVQPRAPCILVSKRHAFLFLKDEIEKKLGKGGVSTKKALANPKKARRS
jgi:hypothetical protein